MGYAADRPGPIVAYVSQKSEPPTDALLRRCHLSGRVLLLPRLRLDFDLDWAPDNGTYRHHRQTGIREPVGPPASPALLQTAAVVVVPALAVDRQGNRLGQGGGSYDRALRQFGRQVPLLALVHPPEILDHVPSAPHDYPVDAVVSIEGIIHCGLGQRSQF